MKLVSFLSPKRPNSPLYWALLAGVLSAVLAAFLLQRYEAEVSGGERVLVLRALAPIERGTLLSDELLGVASVPASYVEARAVRAADRGKVRGVRIASALDTQDTLLWSDLAVSQQRRDLSALVQPGNRAVTVQAALAGDSASMIRPGDYVDVLASLSPHESGYGAVDRNKLTSVLLLQRILVLAVGTVTDPQLLRSDSVADLLRSSREGAKLTLSLKVEEAQLLSLAQERGRLSVMLRPADDTRILEAAPELPVSSLFDSAFRSDLQRRRSEGKKPVRLTSSGVSP
ncbi:MAG: Flp pilus assembly protein CpaB [Polyangiales bacterium]